ncbi:tumor necrosis factor receptor superfamily member 11A isoform X3 [Melozone crissalis]|uniref:tumor necrosis factor receptor superfamily member 11A isoform X3 n=1 Tax=Melozone crissalis TaxID=40204 RepID=UPI0023DCC253|nr:tumor necrosis factor receptor superfamily member 11A isoform X3 [Melozone crissalis]
MPDPSGCWLLLLCLAAAGKQLSLQITPPCESEQHYEYLGRCCRKCEPGKYLSARCTATSDSVCQPCGPNEYMDVWNEEDKCLLHKICDQGKALREVNPGNSTFQRQCACTMGYHWNEDCDCCQRNTMCAPGLGVKPPVQQDRDTMCIPCPRGYFSKVSSSTDECKSWTNCTALGMEEIVPGTDKSDAVCKEQKMPEPSEDADLQNWANEVCSQIKGTKELPRDALVTVNITNAPVPQMAEGTFLLVPSGSPVPGKSCCTSGHTPCRNESPSTEPCEAGEFSVVTETDDYQFPPVPTEDEYMDKDLNNTDYLSLLSQTASKTVSSFSQPMEAGENDSLNQYFSGIGSTEDVSVSPGFHPPSNTDGAHVATDQLLQKSCQHAHSCPKETGNKDIDNFATNCDSKRICVRCGILYRESPQKCYKPCRAAADSTSTSPETGSCAQCTCGLNFLSAGQSTLGNNLGMEDAPSDSTNVKYQNTNGSTSGTQSSTSGTNSSTSDLPPASGNVTGNSNSTFISSGQVMNFKGDIIVVYLSQNSQEGTAASSGLSEDNVGSPVQEENLSRCETFAGNAQHYKEKCAELQGARPAPGSGGPRWPGEALAQEWSPSCGGQASQPVQEEGKLGHFSEKVLN